MRAPKRKRPQVRAIGSPPPNMNLALVANRARYIGSPEHKDAPSFAGQPRPRANASICDRSLAQNQAQITRWLRRAIRRGQVSGFWEGEFPRYVWYRNDDIVYEGRLVNREAGWYKGFPLEQDQWPEGL